MLVRRSMGRGAHSSVDLVQRVSDERLLVCKRCQAGDAVRREASLLESLRHPTIVRVHEHYTEVDTGMLCIIMDFAAGGDLDAHLERRKAAASVPTDAEAFHLLVQLADALSHCHRHRVLHRDVKPANIFLSRPPSAAPTLLQQRAFLGDFSVSRQLEAPLDATAKGGDELLANTITGTPFFLSPEMMQAQRYGHKCDLWSLGVTLYKVLALELPWRASSLPELARQVVHDDPPPLRHPRDAQLLQALRMLLAKRPEDRTDAAGLRRLPALRGERRELRRANRRVSRYGKRVRWPAMLQRQLSSSVLSPVLHLSPQAAQLLVEGGEPEQEAELDAELEACLEVNVADPMGSSAAAAGAGAATALAAPPSPPPTPGLRRVAENTDAYDACAAAATAAPAFSLGLVAFSCVHRRSGAGPLTPSYPGRLYVTATHVAFLPIFFGRRVAIHLERIQCLVRYKAWRLLPGSGSSLQFVLQPAGAQDRDRRVIEAFHSFWDREQLIAAVRSAAAARGVAISVYNRRSLTSSLIESLRGRQHSSSAHRQPPPPSAASGDGAYTA